MNHRNTFDKQYTGIKQIFLEAGHLWAVDDIFERARSAGKVNAFKLYDEFFLLVSDWGLRGIGRDELWEYFRNEITGKGNS